MEQQVKNTQKLIDKEFGYIVSLKTSSFIAFWTELSTGMGVSAYWRGAEG